MNKKNYFKIISEKFSFAAKHYGLFRFLITVVYLFYLATLAINVISATEYIPDYSEAKSRFSPIAAKKEIIYSIERYFSAKQEIFTENSLKPAARNPFLPYEADKSNLINGVDILESENKSIN